MKRRLFRRRAAICALISGVSGIAANLLLAGFFAVARPWVHSSSPWAWLGPANDVTGAISMATMIPVVAYVGRLIPSTRRLRVLAWGSMLAMGALAFAAPLMLSGVVTLTVQFAVAGVGLPVIFGWLVVVNVSGGRAGAIPDSVAVFGRNVGAAALVATAIAGAGTLVPSGSAAQYVVLGLAALVGLPAYLAFPVWPILLARRVFAVESIDRSAQVSAVPPAASAQQRPADHSGGEAR